MATQHTLIGSVTDQAGNLVVACRACGWTAGPVPTGQECGELWDCHLVEVHTARRD